ncbi:MAG: hypothetical protein FGM16_10240 [Flavobacterium sp.]|nr:hypothetical protein [Flavobacterium sp.]
MNDAHYHLVINHFPIMGTIFGVGILIAGLVLKRMILQQTAFVLFIISALTGFLAMYTGEGAEELVENLPGIGHTIIHEHEELAEKFAVVLYALGLLSMATLFLQIKKNGFAKIAVYVTLILSLLAVVLGKAVGTSGGEVRHTEIRTTSADTTAQQKTDQTPSSEQEEEE